MNVKIENKKINPPLDCKTYMLENLLRSFIVLFTIIVGVLSIGRFDTLLALAGCGICTPIALIFPSIFHYLLFNKYFTMVLRNKICFFIRTYKHNKIYNLTI